MVDGRMLAMQLTERDGRTLAIQSIDYTGCSITIQREGWPYSSYIDNTGHSNEIYIEVWPYTIYAMQCNAKYNALNRIGKSYIAYSQYTIHSILYWPQQQYNIKRGMAIHYICNAMQCKLLCTENHAQYTRYILYTILAIVAIQYRERDGLIVTIQTILAAAMQYKERYGYIPYIQYLL